MTRITRRKHPVAHKLALKLFHIQADYHESCVWTNRQMISSFENQLVLFFGSTFLDRKERERKP